MNISNEPEGLKVVCTECKGTGKVIKEQQQSAIIQKPNCPICKGKGYQIIEFKKVN